MTDQQTTAPQGDAGDVARETVHQWGIEYRFKMSADDRERVIASIANLLTQREQAVRAEERERWQRIASLLARTKREGCWSQLMDAIDEIVAAAIRRQVGDQSHDGKFASDGHP
jgi:hypothetical protein